MYDRICQVDLIKKHRKKIMMKKQLKEEIHIIQTSILFKFQN